MEKSKTAKKKRASSAKVKPVGKPKRAPKKALVEAVAADEKTAAASAPRGRMLKGLVIVESPAKAKTLKKYLGRDYDVRASVGHVMDLPKSTLGVDVDDGFKPTYELIKGKTKVVDDLIKAAQRAEHIYLAADPDREGEAIAWHVAEILKMPAERVHRVLFHEITKPAVLKAIANPGQLNQERFESQQARRILDRLVGYKISPILWTKVRRGLSAGRVQSVAVRLIVDREKEVRAFIPKPYWEIEAQVRGENKDLTPRLARIDEDRIDRTGVDREEWATEIVAQSQSGKWRVESIQKKERRANPYPPFITSTLQQESSKRLYFTAKKTMVLAQQLYEGIELGEEGAQGLITYMRTDSPRLANDSVTEARAYLEATHGKEYVPVTIPEYKGKGKAQDAHEAVRPTSLAYTPERVKPFLDEDQFKLYDLIWRRFLASQMTPAISDQTTLDFESKGPNGKSYIFRTTGSVLKFDGFRLMWPVDDKGDEAEQLPKFSETTPISNQGVKSERKETQPPPRFSESSLIKELEDKGIGRPSTYAAILSTIQDRKYVERRENRFYPTELGELVTELLVDNFANIVDVTFTASMEDKLDQIEEGTASWTHTLAEFYTPFGLVLEEAKKKMRDVKREETPTSLSCGKCSKPLIIKWGKNGKFAACQGYPDCRFTSEFATDPDGTIKLVAQPTTDEKCPKCEAPMMVKTGRFGRFLACSSYPTCKTTKAVTMGIACPECKEGELTEKRTRFGKIFFSCARYPTCKYALWDKPIKGRECPQCKHPFLVEHYTKKEGASVRCPNKECGYREASAGPGEAVAPAAV